ncbi:MAG: FkbM family methyltransferase [Halioglobus sp.]|nr:FkbM family methyltransferase [Halioglobus sp.]
MTQSNPAAVHPLRIPGLGSELAMQVHAVADVHVSAAIAGEGIWEPQETRFLLDTLRPGDVFVDVGANIGYFSLLASRLVGESGAVLAFEPEAANFALLEANCRLNGCANIRCFQAALGEENASGTLYLNELNRGDHSLYPEQTGRTGQDISIVNGSRLIGASYPRVDCIKIDTQGAECDVLAGLRELIAASAADLVMVIEFSPLLLKQAGTSGRVLLDLLAGHDWQMYLMDEAALGLLPVSAQQVRSLSDITEQDPESGGFFNLVVSGRALEDNAALHFVRDWGMFEDALAYYLLAQRIRPWSGARRAGAALDKDLYLPSGWAFPEDWGRWSLGRRSVIKFIPAPGLATQAAPLLSIRGRYFGPVEATGVYLNGRHLGDFELRDADIGLPPGSLDGDHMVLELVHGRPLRPADVSDSVDTREIKFGLHSISID